MLKPYYPYMHTAALYLSLFVTAVHLLLLLSALLARVRIDRVKKRARDRREKWKQILTGDDPYARDILGQVAAEGVE